VTKWQISKTHDSGQPWFWKRLSAENRPILTRNWCEASHLSENDLATKAQNFANSKRRTAAILQKFFWLFLIVTLCWLTRNLEEGCRFSLKNRC